VHVCHVIEATIGGTRRHVVDLARGLARRGVEVWLASAQRRDPGFPADLAALAGEGVHCVDVPMVRSIRPGRDLADLRALVELARRVQPDVIHTHSSKAGVLGRLAAASAGRPAVHTPHTFAFLFRAEFRAWQRALFRALEVQLTGSTAAVVAVSRSEAESMCRSGVVPRERVRVVPNGIDAGRWTAARPASRAALGVPEGVPLLSVLGLLHVAKGQDVALRALARPELAAAHLLLAGMGEERGELEELARALGVSERAHFLGWRDDAPALVAASDVVLLPSRWEGMPYIVLESMAAARPVVAARVDGAVELVDDGRTGALVEIEDHAGLARAVARVLALGPGERERMGALARERVLATYTIDRMLDALLAVYAEVA
jgi:glycosyltransferase involved in cell wall biosynthesis